MTGAAAASTPAWLAEAVQRVLITCGGSLGARLTAGVAAHGGVATMLPLTRISAAADRAALTEAVTKWAIGGYDWMLVTSANGADAVAAAAESSSDTRGLTSGGAVGAVGEATAAALTAHGFTVALTPAVTYTGAALAEAFVAAHPGPAPGPASGPGDGSAPARGTGGSAHTRPALRVLLPLSSLASDDMERILRAAGHRPHRVTAYQTVPAEPTPELAARVAQGEYSSILVSSASAARELAARCAEIPPTVQIIAIGQPTALALREAGLRADTVAAVHTAEGLLSALFPSDSHTSSEQAATQAHRLAPSIKKDAE